MKSILIVYDSGYGATESVAEIIGQSFLKRGNTVVTTPVPSAKDITEYDGLIVGSPMRFSRCTVKIKKFLTTNRNALSFIPVAFFFTCMSGMKTDSQYPYALYIDPSLNASSQSRRGLGFMKKNHAVSYYLKHFIKLIPGVDPLGIAFFKGRLKMDTLSLIHKIVMRFAMFTLPEIQEGDFINPSAVRTWAESLSKKLDVV